MAGLLIYPRQPLEACFTLEVMSVFIFLFSGTVTISKKQGLRPVEDLCDVHPALGNNGSIGLSPGEM